jgi:hypothetical protein
MKHADIFIAYFSDTSLSQTMVSGIYIAVVTMAWVVQ